MAESFFDQQTQDLSLISADDIYRDVYPEGIDLRPGSETHEKVLANLNRFAEASKTFIDRRKREWERIDAITQTYIPAKDVDGLRKNKKKYDPTKPVRIVYPYSLALLESGVSALSATYNRNPIFRYVPVESADTTGAKLLEAVIDLQCRRNKVPLALHTMHSDSLKYGVGIGFPTWVEDTGPTYFSPPIDGASSSSGIIFEGNGLKAIDPYNYLPDPNVSVDTIQEGEYVGFIDRTNYINLLEAEQNLLMFNVQYAKRAGIGFSRFIKERRDNTKTDGQIRPEQNDKASKAGLVDVAYFYARIIPKDWGLGDSEYVEKWYFAVAGDRIILAAAPIGLRHNKFPIAVCAPIYDGHSALPISKLESIQGMQELVNWLFNSHIENLRRSMHSIFVYDPFMISTNDLINDNPQKFVRARRDAYGKGNLSSYIQQLPVADVTSQNISNAQSVMSFMQMVGGIDESAMGILRQGGPERLSAAEFAGTQQGLLGRFENMLTSISYMCMHDIGRFFAYHNAAYMSRDVYVEILGELPSELDFEYGRRTQVSPDQINADYDVLIEDATILRGQNLEFWTQFLDRIQVDPELRQTFSLERIVLHIAREAGVKNAEDFKMVPLHLSTASDANVEAEAQAGNLIGEADYVADLGF